nr:MAG TPA: hypothetical protein [Caudoviricetes sp.]
MTVICRIFFFVVSVVEPFAFCALRSQYASTYFLLY